MIVKAGGTTDKRHNAIRVRQLEKLVDLRITQALRQQAESELRL
jgi:hypothetical protein